MVFESQEKDDFWSALGGKQVYHSDKRLQYNGQMPIARLFELSNASGKINVNEIYDYNQNDLNPNEVMILDAWETVFIWFGSESNKQEREESEKVVFDYLKSDPSQRGVDIPIFKIKQGLEPPNFTGFFGPWDSEYSKVIKINVLYKSNLKILNKYFFKTEDDYNGIKQELHSKNQPHLFQTATKEKSYTNGNGLKQNSSSSISFSEYPKYSYDQLVKPIEELPENVLSEFKELHLSEDDFQKIFKMSYQEFKEKPAWKQKELKRFVRLF